MTMDLHAQQLQGFFKRPMDHLYATPMLAEIGKRIEHDNMVIVSPDAGYAKQARKFASTLNLPIAIGDKDRVDHTENASILEAVSYTHLDVYKRQLLDRRMAAADRDDGSVRPAVVLPDAPADRRRQGRHDGLRKVPRAADRSPEQ